MAEKEAEQLINPEGLNEVRNILYGEQHRDMEDRVNKLEQSFREGLKQLTHRMEMELTNLEAGSEGSDQSRGVARRLESRIEETEAAANRETGEVRQQVTEMHEQVGRATAKLAEQLDMLTHRLKETENHFKKVTDELHQQLTSGLVQMEHRKADNEQLASLFEAMSKRLKKDH